MNKQISTTHPKCCALMMINGCCIVSGFKGESHHCPCAVSNGLLICENIVEDMIYLYYIITHQWQVAFRQKYSSSYQSLSFYRQLSYTCVFKVNTVVARNIQQNYNWMTGQTAIPLDRRALSAYLSAQEHLQWSSGHFPLCLAGTRSTPSQTQPRWWRTEIKIIFIWRCCQPQEL